MKNLNSPLCENEEKEWPVRTYYKRELAMAYAPDIAPSSAVNRLTLWLKHNPELYRELVRRGYEPRKRFFTSLQVEAIFHYLGRP